VSARTGTKSKVYGKMSLHPIKYFHTGKNNLKCVSYHKFSGLWLMCKYEKIRKIGIGYIQFLHSYIFKDFRIKRITPMESYNFNNQHEITKFEE